MFNDNFLGKMLQIFLLRSFFQPGENNVGRRHTRTIPPINIGVPPEIKYPPINIGVPPEIKYPPIIMGLPPITEPPLIMGLPPVKEPPIVQGIAPYRSTISNGVISLNLPQSNLEPQDQIWARVDLPATVFPM